jgi:hypothetical protein
MAAILLVSIAGYLNSGDGAKYFDNSFDSRSFASFILSDLIFAEPGLVSFISM